MQLQFLLKINSISHLICVTLAEVNIKFYFFKVYTTFFMDWSNRKVSKNSKALGIIFSLSLIENFVCSIHFIRKKFWGRKLLNILGVIVVVLKGDQSKIQSTPLPLFWFGWRPAYRLKADHCLKNQQRYNSMSWKKNGPAIFLWSSAP